MGKLCPLRKTPRFAKYRDKEFLDKSRVLYIEDTVLLIPNNWSSNTFILHFLRAVIIMLMMEITFTRLIFLMKSLMNIISLRMLVLFFYFLNVVKFRFLLPENRLK